MKDKDCRVFRFLGGIFYVILLLSVIGIKGEEAKQEEENTLRKREESVKTDGRINEKAEEVPKIALTFDDGPSASCTGRLLDGLKERNIKATFFLIGENAKANPELVKRMYEEGHLIGNHTYHHVQLTSVSEETAAKEITETAQVIYEITGMYPAYMRPPFGSYPENLELSMEFLPVLWTIDPLDWTTKNVDEVVHKVVTNAGENDMILLHDCYESSVDAALQIADILKKEGFEFVTVDQLLVL